MVCDLSANVAVFFVLLNYFDIQRNRRLWMGERSHHFLHAGEDLSAAMLPVFGGVYAGVHVIGEEEVREVAVVEVVRWLGDCQRGQSEDAQE